LLDIYILAYFHLSWTWFCYYTYFRRFDFGGGIWPEYKTP